MKYVATLACVGTLIANTAFAQLAEATDETVEALRQLIVNNGDECATVTNMAPVNNSGLMITCKKKQNRDATAVYLIEVSGDGLIVTKQ